jgi:chemotaxis protein CheD
MLEENKKTYYDQKFQAYSTVILPGEYSTTNQEGHMLVTILGSCVAACIRDPVLKIGGINHFLLAKPSLDLTSSSSRYGSTAMECLINEILKKGGERSRLEVKVFGGSDLIQSSLKVGNQNSEFVLKYIKAEGLRLLAEDLGGDRPRRIHYWPYDGRVLRQIIQPQEVTELITKENTYRSKLTKEPEDGDIELFN